MSREQLTYMIMIIILLKQNHSQKSSINGREDKSRSHNDVTSFNLIQQSIMINM